jgi:hypothetical protein
VECGGGLQLVKVGTRIGPALPSVAACRAVGCFTAARTVTVVGCRFNRALPSVRSTTPYFTRTVGTNLSRACLKDLVLAFFAMFVFQETQENGYQPSRIIKVNIDGSFHPDVHAGSIGAVLRDHDGRFCSGIF